MDLKNFLSRNDRFASKSGCILREVREGYARAEVRVTKDHLNGGGVCQGGVYFTLADIAIAGAMNSHGEMTFSLEANVMFLRSAREGDVLTAEAREVVNHHKVPYIEARVTDGSGNLCCVVTSLAYRKGKVIGHSEPLVDGRT